MPYFYKDTINNISITLVKKLLKIMTRIYILVILFKKISKYRLKKNINTSCSIKKFCEVGLNTSCSFVDMYDVFSS